jgi:hypothetical protein
VLSKVNEIAGVPETPAFLLHKPADADGMTLTDVVFAAFLHAGDSFLIRAGLSHRQLGGVLLASTSRSMLCVNLISGRHDKKCVYSGPRGPLPMGLGGLS